MYAIVNNNSLITAGIAITIKIGERIGKRVDIAMAN